MCCSRHLGRLDTELLDDDGPQSFPHICLIGRLATLPNRLNNMRVHFTKHRELCCIGFHELDAELVLDGHDQLNGAQAHSVFSVEQTN